MTWPKGTRVRCIESSGELILDKVYIVRHSVGSDMHEMEELSGGYFTSRFELANFAVGDIVECIEAKGKLVLGDHYEITGFKGDMFINIKGSTGDWFKSRFKLVSEPSTMEQINAIDLDSVEPECVCEDYYNHDADCAWLVHKRSKGT